MNRHSVHGGREMADIAAESNGYTRPCQETRNNVTSEFGARAAPGAQVYSVELAEANAANARRIWAHASVADRITCVVGTIGDGGRTLDALSGDHGFASGALDFMFLDHDKDAGSIAVADNVRIPSAPKYREYMRQQQGKLWQTTEYKAHLEYQSLVSDLVLESEYLAG
jgi:catechol O-methyltransferase